MYFDPYMAAAAAANDSMRLQVSYKSFFPYEKVKIEGLSANRNQTKKIKLLQAAAIAAKPATEVGSVATSVAAAGQPALLNVRDFDDFFCWVWCNCYFIVKPPTNIFVQGF